MYYVFVDVDIQREQWTLVDSLPGAINPSVCLLLNDDQIGAYSHTRHNICQAEQSKLKTL